MRSIRKKWNRGMVTVTVTALSGLLAAACASTDSQPSQAQSGAGAVTTVSIGITSATAPPTLLSEVASSLGIAGKNGLRFSFVTINPQAVAQALATGRIDILASPSIESAIVNGAPFQIIAGAAKPYFSLWGRKGVVGSWQSLAGKTVGIPAGQDSAAAVLFNVLLPEQHVSASSVTEEYGTADGNYQSMAAGAVAAGFTTPPYTYKLESSGKWAEIDPMTKEQAGYFSTQFTSSSSYISTHKAAINSFVETILQAQQLMQKQPGNNAVLAAIDKELSASSINPADFDIPGFLKFLATSHTWQIVPTRAIINNDISLLRKMPSARSAALHTSFKDLVYEVPALLGKY
jgi:ABC-type nitrate/sulfonate/bicarbonate transport system substrate-binding protein